MYKTIIFDLDGTLIDSSLGIKSAVRKVINNFNLQTLNNDELNGFISTSPIQKAFMEFCHIDKITAQKCAEDYRKNYIAGDLYNARIYAGITELIQCLKKQNYKIGIASYKRQDTLDKIVTYFKLDKFFESICGADNENKLTKKDILKICIEKMNTTPKKTIFIGDSLSDGLAAIELGCSFIAVTYGYGFKTKTDLTQCNSTFVAKSVCDIQNFIIEDK